MLNDGLIFAYKLNGDGYGEKLTPEGVKENLDSDSLVWIHLDYSSTETIEWLQNNQYFNEWVAESLAEESVRSRAIIQKDYIYACLRSVNLNRDEQHEDMVSVRVFISDKLIVTTRKRDLMYVKTVLQSLNEGEGPSSPIDVLSCLIEEINIVLSNHINTITDSIDEIEEDYLDSLMVIKRDDISAMRRKILLLKRHLTPQKEALKQLSSSQSNMLKPLRQLFHDHYDTNARLVEELDLARERCALLQEQISNKLSEQINSRMYIFSMITALFLPISSVASLFGMNLGGIPGTNNVWGFGVVCFILIFTSSALFLFLKKRKWF